MPEPDEATRVRHMIEAAQEAISFVEGLTRDDLPDDRMLLLALTRLIEIIGEASTHVTDETKAKFPDVPWPAIRGTRNRIVHAYFDVDVDVLWDTLMDDLPPMIDQLEKILASLSPR
jgi:uncharacterized protein with HEPN domain